MESRQTVLLEKRLRIAGVPALDKAIRQMNISPINSEEMDHLSELVLTRNDKAAAVECQTYMPRVLAKIRQLEKLVESQILGDKECASIPTV